LLKVVSTPALPKGRRDGVLGDEKGVRHTIDQHKIREIRVGASGSARL